VFVFLWILSSAEREVVLALIGVVLSHLLNARLSQVVGNEGGWLACSSCSWISTWSAHSPELSHVHSCLKLYSIFIGVRRTQSLVRMGVNVS
jgi:hypothetical protein